MPAGHKSSGSRPAFAESHPKEAHADQKIAQKIAQKIGHKSSGSRPAFEEVVVNESTKRSPKRSPTLKRERTLTGSQKRGERDHLSPALSHPGVVAGFSAAWAAYHASEAPPEDARWAAAVSARLSSDAAVVERAARAYLAADTRQSSRGWGVWPFDLPPSMQKFARSIEKWAYHALHANQKETATCLDKIEVDYDAL
jgi:hypothetical protein